MFLSQFRKLFKKISFRLTFFYALLFIFSSFLIFLLNYLLLDQSLKSRDHEVLYAKVKEYNSVLSKGGIEELKNYLAEQKTIEEEAQFLIRIETAAGQTAFIHIPEKLQKLTLSEIEMKMASTKINIKISKFQMKDLDSEDAGDFNDYESTSLALSGGQRIQVAKNTDDRDDLLERYRRITSLVSVVVLLMGVVGGYALSSQALSPIRNLIQIMKRVRAGELTARVPIRNSNDELDEIGKLFNKMTDKIQRVVLNMQETLDHVAHDLKTPLTRLKTSAELVLLKPSTEAEYKSALADTIENTTEIVSFINSLMDISEAQAGVLKLNLVELQASTILAEVIDLYSLTAEEKNISIQLSQQTDFKFQADKNRARQVFSNLIDNAIKYSPVGSQIKIFCEGRNEYQEIRFVDQGSGISQEDLPRIWERLFRGQDSQVEKGLGLGLSLVKSICKAHGWKITVQSQRGVGSEFILSLRPSA